MKSEKRIMRELAQPFNQEDLEWRVQAVGKTNDGKPWARVLAYVTNRAIQQRLDDVCGAFGWKNNFYPLPNSVGDGAMCSISIKFGDEWITKYDGADNTNIEATKGGLSGAMKRAGVQWNIGRYLYDIEAMYAECKTSDEFQALKSHEKEEYIRAEIKDSKPKAYFYWKPKPLAAKFLPQKYVNLPISKDIEKLAKETDTKMKDILDNYGVDDVRDLFATEAGNILALLTKKKARIEEEKNATNKTH